MDVGEVGLRVIGLAVVGFVVGDVGLRVDGLRVEGLTVVGLLVGDVGRRDDGLDVVGLEVAVDGGVL